MPGLPLIRVAVAVATGGLLADARPRTGWRGGLDRRFRGPFAASLSVVLRCD